MFVSRGILYEDCVVQDCVTRHGETIFSVSVIARTLFSRRSRRLVRYDCRSFTNGFQSMVETDVTEESSKQIGRNGTGKNNDSGRCPTYIGIGGTKVCIESRNANASNIDTASPFERSLNLSRHSSHPFPCESTANPSTGPLRVRIPRIPPERENTRAHRERVGGWSERTANQ